MSENVYTSNYIDQDDEVLSIYLEEINEIPMISHEEEYELAVRAKNGDRVAFNKLINANLRFVVSVAKKYRGQGLPLSDLINEGNIGLITALEKFEPEKGYHFISYAVWWIRQSILKALSEKGRLVRLPLNRTNEYIQISKAKEKLAHSKESDEVSTKEIAEETGLEENLVKELLQVTQDTVNLDSKIKGKDESETTFAEFLIDPNGTPEDEIVSSSLNEEVNSLLSVLTDKERNIISLRYGLTGEKPKSLKEIGDSYNLTKERIRQIEKRVLEKLRKEGTTRGLECYANAV